MTVKLSEIERAAEWAVLALAEQDLAEQIARLPALTAALRDVLTVADDWEANAPDRIVGKAVASDIRAAITAHVDPT